MPQYIYIFKHFGFTLAEVLITLGIIGIVATLTIPALITNYQKKQTAVKLSKFYSIMNQAILQWENDEGITPEDSIFTLEDVGNISKIKDWINNGIGKYIKTITSEEETAKHYKIAFSDGSGFSSYIGLWGPSKPVVYFFYCTDYKYCKYESYDGKKTFLFTLYKGKFITSYPSSDGLTREELIEKCKVGVAKGRRHNCTRLIEMDGWEIRKDYPWEQIIPDTNSN